LTASQRQQLLVGNLLLEIMLKGNRMTNTTTGVKVALTCVLLALGSGPVAAQQVPPVTQSVVQSGDGLQLKRKVAVARFTNATRYGRALLLPGEADPVENQATDILVARLVETNAFIISDRDTSLIGAPNATSTTPKFGGLDAVVVGSVTELGRRAEGRAGFLNSTVRQIATAKVDIRLVDPRTNQAFFSTSGTGTATLEAKEVAGFGSVASYDSALIDRAISAAISDVSTNLIQNLQARQWSTDVLDVHGSEAMISGGQSQGLRVGQELVVEEAGRAVTSAQSGSIITLPGRQVARVQVVSFFGATGAGEGSVVRLLNGNLTGVATTNLRVLEAK
jgi:curli biogenesis system outer membrane secretion channel CsgG